MKVLIFTFAFVGLGIAFVGVDIAPVCALGLILTGIGGFLGVHDGVRRGEIRTNWGACRRDRQPWRFCLEAAFWYGVIGVWMAFAVAVGFGLV